MWRARLACTYMSPLSTALSLIAVRKVSIAIEVIESSLTIHNFLRRSVLSMLSRRSFNPLTPFDAPGEQAFWKHCGKRRNCSLRAIFPFPTVFATCLGNFLPFSPNVKLSSANSFSLEESKILSSGNGLTSSQRKLLGAFPHNYFQSNG